MGVPDCLVDWFCVVHHETGGTDDPLDETAANHLVQEMGDPRTTNYSDAFHELKDACSEVTETSYEKMSSR